MKTESITKVFSVMLVVSGILLIIWWLLLGLSQSLGNAGDSLSKLAQTSTWVPINIVGLLASLLLVFGLIGILTGHSSRLRTLGFLGIVSSVSGTVLFTALQFDETFVWPLLAAYADQLLEIKGPMFTDPTFVTGYVVMGVLFILGFVFITAQNPAKYLGGLDEFGTIGVGKRADLVLLDENPLENIANTRRIAGVMVKLRWYSRAELDEMLELLAKANE